MNLDDIGEGDDALLCITELSACCQQVHTNDTGSALGNWFFPNGTIVPSEVVYGTTGLQFDIYRTRGHSMVLLHRRKGGVNGIYRCEIPDALGVIQTIYIEATTGEWYLNFGFIQHQDVFQQNWLYHCLKLYEEFAVYFK